MHYHVTKDQVSCVAVSTAAVLLPYFPHFANSFKVSKAIWEYFTELLFTIGALRISRELIELTRNPCNNITKMNNVQMIERR